MPADANGKPWILGAATRCCGPSPVRPEADAFHLVRSVRSAGWNMLQPSMTRTRFDPWEAPRSGTAPEALSDEMWSIPEKETGPSEGCNHGAPITQFSLRSSCYRAETSQLGCLHLRDVGTFTYVSINLMINVCRASQLEVRMILIAITSPEGR